MNRAQQPALEVLRDDFKRRILFVLTKVASISLDMELSDVGTRALAELVHDGLADLGDDGSALYANARGRFRWAEIAAEQDRK